MGPRLRSSEVRTSVRGRTRSTSFRNNPAILGTAARVRALSEASPKSLGSSQTPLQSLAFRGDLQDTLRRFTPPRTCCWLGERVWFVLGDCSPQTDFPAHQCLKHLVSNGHTRSFQQLLKTLKCVQKLLLCRT